MLQVRIGESKRSEVLSTRSVLEGERKLVTAMFADVANFTSLSEKLEPEEVHQIMEGCPRILMDKIHFYEETGDTISS